MHLPFYFTFSYILSQFHFSPLLHQEPQHVQQHSSDYSGRVWTKSSSQSQTDHDPLIFGSFIGSPVSWNKLLQITFWGKFATPAPKPDFILVQSHNCSFIQVAHKCKTTAQSIGNKKRPRCLSQSAKWLQGECSIGTLFTHPGDCKESVQLAHFSHIQEIKNPFNSFK
jgi:hypothetical protein